MNYTEAIKWSRWPPTTEDILIGISSNIIWSDKGYQEKRVIVDQYSGFQKFDEDQEKRLSNYWQLGEDWDSVVARSVADNL